MARGGASDRAIDRAVGVDHVDADHRSRSEHVGFKFIIMARLEPRGGISCADRVDAGAPEINQTRAYLKEL